MTSTAPLTNSTILSPHVTLTPEQMEKRKTEQQRAEDWIYTSNHSVTCLAITDTIGLTFAANVANTVKGWFTGKKGNFKINHDHDNGYGAPTWIWDRITGKHKDHDYVHKIHHEEKHRIAHDIKHALQHEAEDLAAGRKVHIHPDPAPKLTPDASGKAALKKYWTTGKRWVFAEAVGDIGSVPVTIALQRWAPGFMEGVRNIIEPVIGKGFHKNTTRAAQNWGHRHGFANDSQEVKERADQLYEYEMRHMPQMAVWTVSSIGLNFAAMHLFHKIDPRQYERLTFQDFAIVKGLGAAMTAGLVLGVRGLVPGGAHKWDQTVGKYVALPVTKFFGKLAGVKSEQVDQFQKDREEQSLDMKATSAPTAPPVAKPVESKAPAATPVAAPKTTVQSASAEHEAPDVALATPPVALAV